MTIVQIVKCWSSKNEYKVVDFVFQLSLVHVSAWASCVHVWVCTLYLELFMTYKTKSQHQIFSPVFRVYCKRLTVAGCWPAVRHLCSGATRDCLLMRRKNFPRMTTAEPFQFLAPWLSDGQTCGTENMETSAKRESWFSDPLNWIHAGLLYRSTWWTCRPTMSQTQPFNK